MHDAERNRCTRIISPYCRCPPPLFPVQAEERKRPQILRFIRQINLGCTEKKDQNGGQRKHETVSEREERGLELDKSNVENDERLDMAGALGELNKTYGLI